MDRQMTGGRAWLAEAVRRIEADYNRSADTLLILMPLPRHPGITPRLTSATPSPSSVARPCIWR